MSIFWKCSIETNFGNIHLKTLQSIISKNMFKPAILTLDENTKEINHEIVKDVIYSEKPTMVVQCSNKHICCTPEHLILTIDGYKRADEIEVDEKIILTNLSYTYVTGVIKELKVRPVIDVILENGTNYTCKGLFVKCMVKG